MMVRATLRVKARSASTFNEGTLDNGKPWSNHTFDAIDADENKITIRVDGNTKIDVGAYYDVVCDVESMSREKVRLIARQITAVAKAA